MKNNFFFKKQFSNIYKKASKNSEVTSQIIYGEKFKILSKNKEWIKIKTIFDNYTGYIKNKDYVEKFFPKYKVYSLKEHRHDRQRPRHVQGTAQSGPRQCEGVV